MCANTVQDRCEREGFTWFVTFLTPGDQHKRHLSKINTQYSHKLSVDGNYLLVCSDPSLQSCAPDSSIIASAGTKQEIQEITLGDDDFSIVFLGQTTGLIPINASIDDLSYELNSILGFGIVTVNCTTCAGTSIGNVDTITVTFNSLRGDVPLISITDSDATVREIQKGISQRVVGRFSYSTVVQGLSSLSNWHVRIYSYSKYGAGMPTDAFPFPKRMAIMPPSIPLNIIADVAGAQSTTIGWDAPRYDGGISVDNFGVDYDTSPTFLSSSRTTMATTELDNSVCVVMETFSSHHEESNRKRLRISDSNLIQVNVITLGTEILIEHQQFVVVEVNTCGSDCLVLDREVDNAVTAGSKIFLGFDTRMFSYRIDGLTPGREYFVRVTAQNQNGLHGPSSYLGYPNDAMAIVPMSVPF